MLEWLAGYRNESWMGFLTRDTLEKATRWDTCTHTHMHTRTYTHTHITPTNKTPTNKWRRVV